MNVFFLSPDPTVCAKEHCDKHCVKMIVEYAQLLSTAHRVLDGQEVPALTKSGRKTKRWVLAGSLDNELYQATHVNHPSAIWARASKANYQWLYKLFIALCDEYTRRYGKVHATYAKLKDILVDFPINIKDNVFFEPPQAMPDECKREDVIEGYRNYYLTAKKQFATWKFSAVPLWWNHEPI